MDYQQSEDALGCIDDDPNLLGAFAIEDEVLNVNSPYRTNYQCISRAKYSAVATSFACAIKR